MRSTQQETRNETAADTTHTLRAISVVGGFLDGLRLEFTEGLNCVIGARGTGKTTVLELLRYALDQAPESPSERKRFLSLVQENLGGGQVKVDLVTRDGLEYRVCRAWNEPPIVRGVDDWPTQVTVQGGSLFRADIYSQNEIEQIAEDGPAQLALLDQFEAERIQRIKSQIQRVELALKSTTNRIQPLAQQIATLTDEVATLPNVEEKLQRLAQGDAGISMEVNVAHQHKALRDRETRRTHSASRSLSQVSRDLAAMVGQVVQRTQSLVDREVFDGPNGPLTMTILQIASECGVEIDLLLEEVRTRIAGAQGELNRQGAPLTTLHDTRELEFRKTIEAHKRAQGRVTERAGLERVRNELMEKRRKRTELQSELVEAESESVRLTERLVQLRGERFAVRRAVVMRINEALEPTIRVSLDEQGDASGFQRLLEDWLKKARMKHGLVARRIASSMSPTLLGEAIRSGDAELLVTKAGVSESQAGKVIHSLDDPRFLFELETLDLDDLPLIELFDCGKYRESLAPSADLRHPQSEHPGLECCRTRVRSAK